MKKFATLLILLLLIAVLLAVTKPNKQDFELFISQEFNSKQNSSLLGSVISKGIGYNAKRTIQYKDKIFFSLVTTKIVNEERKFIGIIGQWIPLKN